MGDDRLIVPVLLSGGTGKRLWPLSQAAVPKQFLRLIGERSLLQETALRTAGHPGWGPAVVVANAAHRDLVAGQLAAIDLNHLRIVLEPIGRNTAFAAAVAATLAAQMDPAALVLLMPVDHIIGNPDAFLAAVETGREAAQAGLFVLFGVAPDRPATGFGYIVKGEPLDALPGVCRVARFVEKPPVAVAKSYLAAGTALWNSGIFLLPAGDFLNEVRRLAPDVSAAAAEAVANAVPDGAYLHLDRRACEAAPAISIDHAVFEKTDRAAVVSTHMQWSDVGTWSSLWEAGSKDPAGNVIVGPVLADGTTGSYLRSEGPPVAAIGLKDVVLVATDQAVLVIDRSEDQAVKQLADRLQQVDPIRNATG